jgi:predicted dehydrogenase
MIKNKLRFGIIGCSRIASSSTIPAIINSEFSELAMIGSRSEEKGKQFAEKFNCKKFGTYDEVLEDKSIDAVYISLPVGLHEEWTIKAAKSGKHILCEKSSSTSFESAKKMINSAKENEVRLMEGFMFRFHPSHKKIREILDSKKIGKVFLFSGQYGFPSIPKNDIRFNKELGGGILNDAGCYPICASRFTFQKEPEQVMCDLVIDPESGVDVKMNISLKYGANQFANMASGYGLFYQSFYSIWGTDGSLYLSRSYNIPSDMKAKLLINSNMDNEELYISPYDHFKLMIDSFSAEVLGKSLADFNFEIDLLNQAKVLEAARISNEKKTFVFIKDLKT